VLRAVSLQGGIGRSEISLSECGTNVFDDVGKGEGREQEQNSKRAKTHLFMMQRSRKSFQSGKSPIDPRMQG